MSNTMVVKTVLTANDADVRSAFKRTGAEADILGNKLKRAARESESAWGHFKNKFKEGFMMGGGIAIAGRAADFLVDKIKDLTHAVPEFVEKADSIGKASEKLGLTTDAFQRLSYAMNLSDIKAETMDATFKKLNMGLGQLKTNAGPIESGLKKINPALMSNLRTATDATDAFLITADAIQKTTDPAKRAAIAQAVFGKQGQELIPILLKGKEGIQDLMAETDKYGEVLSGKTIEAAGKFQDSQKRLTASMTQIKGVILSTMVTRLEPFVTKMAEWFAVNKDLIGTKIESFMDRMVKAGTSFFGWIKPLLPSIMDLAKSVGGLFGSTFKALGPLIDKLMPVAQKLFEGIGPSLVTVIEKLTPLIVKLADLVAEAAGIVLGKDDYNIGILSPIIDPDKTAKVTESMGNQVKAALSGSAAGFTQFDIEKTVNDIFTRKRGTANSGPHGMLLQGPELLAAQMKDFDTVMSRFTPEQQQIAQGAAGRYTGNAPNAASLGVQTALTNNIKVEVNGVPGAQVKTSQTTGQKTMSSGRTAPAVPSTGRGGDLE